MEGSFTFVKVDVDEQREIASKYKITAMPTFILLKDGEQVQSVRGANPPAIQTLVKSAVSDIEKAQTEKKEEPSTEESTVSGSYTLSSNSNWKTSL